VVKATEAKPRGPGEDHAETWLGVETSTPTGSVAVWKNGLAFEQILRIQKTHSERILPAIDHALAMTETSPSDVNAFIVGAGPGSFTGVRIAASLGKGWSMARGIPLFAYSSLLAVAVGSGARGSVCAMVDARRGQVYAACYRVTERGTTEELAPGAWHVADLLAELSRRRVDPIFAGAGAIVYRESITGIRGDAVILPAHLGLPRAANLLWLRAVEPELGRVATPEAWEPTYVREWRVPEDKR
jgi:tRNA threonylcarbamoyladenosine biosynthesis protein TsaB